MPFSVPAPNIFCAAGRARVVLRMIGTIGTHQVRDPVEMMIVDLEPFQTMDRVEEIVPAGAEGPTGARNHAGRVSL